MPFPSIQTSTFVADLIADLGLIGLAINAVLLRGREDVFEEWAVSFGCYLIKG